MRNERRWLGVTMAALASIAMPFLVPALVVGGLYADHALAFAGTCGPYAPDIPSYPCSYDEYSDNFFGGFDAIGLVFIALLTFVATIVFVVLAWLLAGIALAVARGVRTRPART